MSALAGLKLIAAKRPTNASPVVQRRQKLALRIAEQIQLAKAQEQGRVLELTRQRRVKDSATGTTSIAEVPKRIQPWWWATENGKLALTVRYGAKVIELAKGKPAIEVSGIEQIVPTLNAVVMALNAGEIDAAIQAASGQLREGFKK